MKLSVCLFLTTLLIISCERDFLHPSQNQDIKSSEAKSEKINQENVAFLLEQPIVQSYAMAKCSEASFGGIKGDLAARAGELKPELVEKMEKLDLFYQLYRNRLEHRLKHFFKRWKQDRPSIQWPEVEIAIDILTKENCDPMGTPPPPPPPPDPDPGCEAECQAAYDECLYSTEYFTLVELSIDCMLANGGSIDDFEDEEEGQNTATGEQEIIAPDNCNHYFEAASNYAYDCELDRGMCLWYCQ